MDYERLATGPCAGIGEAITAFLHKGAAVGCERYGNGHINDT